MPVVSNWTEERKQELKALYESGLSSSQIAAEMNCGLTRNSIIGKIHRMELSRDNGHENRNPSGRTRRHQPYKPREKRIRIIRSNGNSNSMRVVETVTSDMQELRCVEVVPRNVPLMDLEGDDCRYPTTEDSPFLFCGHPKLDGHSYCVPHFFLCLKPEHASQGREAHAHTIAAYKKRFNASVLSLREKPEADWEVA